MWGESFLVRGPFGWGSVGGLGDRVRVEGGVWGAVKVA